MTTKQPIGSLKKTLSSRIVTKCSVEERYGPLVANFNPNIKHRRRSKVVEIVVRTTGLHIWSTVFNFDDQFKIVHSRSLIDIFDEN